VTFAPGARGDPDVLGKKTKGFFYGREIETKYILGSQKFLGGPGIALKLLPCIRILSVDWLQLIF
jgi:hypothetical protein